MEEKIEEGACRLSVGSRVFYNPKMSLCRSMFSLAVGSLGKKISVIDAMCASGVRGLRYKLENKNVVSLVLSDRSLEAIKYARKNAKLNKVKCGIEKADACKSIAKHGCDLIELDPFGTPQPFLGCIAAGMESKKNFWFSVTATDMAVLCGANHAACVKNYGSTPIDNEFCHENAVRILVTSVIRAFAPHNLAPEPVFSFSHLHYIKVLFSIKRDAKHSVDQAKKIGNIAYCRRCLYRKYGRFVGEGDCPDCKTRLEIGTGLYLGSLWDSALCERMEKLNAKRKYSDSKAIGRALSEIIGERKIEVVGTYDLHLIAKKRGTPILSMEASLERLRGAGFAAHRTHFCPTAVRTSAPHKDVLRLLS